MHEEYKFPRTLHLPGSDVVDTDRSLSWDDVATFCHDCEVVIQEKLDGACVGVYFADEVPVLLKRGGLIGTREKDQYNLFRS